MNENAMFITNDISDRHQVCANYKTDQPSDEKKKNVEYASVSGSINREVKQTKEVYKSFIARVFFFRFAK